MMGVEKQRYGLLTVFAVSYLSPGKRAAHIDVWDISAWVNILETNKKEAHTSILFLLLGKQMRTKKSVSQTREVAATLSHSFELKKYRISMH